MNVFVAHSKSDAQIARAIATKLRAKGLEVFVDEDNLPAGRSYDDRIRASIQAADVFLFVLSPAAIAEGCYAMTELSIARQSWPNPDGRVLAVMVTPMDLKAVDPYLTAGGTILRPSGDVATEAAHAAHGLVRRHARRRWIAIGAASAVAIATAGTAIALWAGGGSSTSDANTRIATDAGTADADASDAAEPLPSLDSVFVLHCKCDIGSVFCGGFVVASGTAVTHERCTHCPGSTAPCALTIAGPLSSCRPEVDPRPLDPISNAALIRLRGCVTPDPLPFGISSLRPGSELRAFGFESGELAPVRVRLDVDAEGQLRAKGTEATDEHAQGGPFIDDRHRVVGVLTGIERMTFVLLGNDATVLRDALRSQGITVRQSR